MKSTDIIFTIMIIVIFLGLYVANILAIGMKKVKDNWPLYRCSPAVMPFASIFGHDTGDNFMQCIQATQSGYMDYLMMPLNHVISLVGSVATKIVKDTESIRGFIGGLREKIMSVFKNIFGVFNNIIIGFQRIIIAMRDLVNKLAGIFATLMFVMSSALMVMKSLWGGIFGQMVRALGKSYKMSYERGAIMLAHSAMIGIAIYLMMRYVFNQSQFVAEDRSIVIAAFVLIYMIMFGHGMPGQINKNLSFLS